MNSCEYLDQSCEGEDSLPNYTINYMSPFELRNQIRAYIFSTNVFMVSVVNPYLTTHHLYIYTCKYRSPYSYYVKIRHVYFVHMVCLADLFTPRSHPPHILQVRSRHL